MALKAGYVGVKRWLYEKLQKTTTENVQGITDLWNDNALTGVKNLNGSRYVATTTGGIVWSYDENGVLDANGTATANSARGTDFTAPFSAQVILSGCNSGKTGIHMYPYDDTAAARPYKDSSKTSRLGTTDNVYNGNEISFWMEEGHLYNMTCRVQTGATADHVKFYPLLRLAADPDNTYAPFAKTNQQLTADIATDAATLEDHKTTINGIISAATGAADFAAFKTAMAALSPLTRSAAPAERSLEVEEEEPEVVKKTTRKTTKKEVE